MSGAEANPPKANGEKGEPQNWWKSLLLIGFTAIVGAMSILLLSATLAQSRISNLIFDGVSLTVWKLEQVRSQWSDTRGQQRIQLTILAIAEARHRRLASDQASADAITAAKWSQTFLALQSLTPRVSVLDSDLGKRILDKPVQEQVAHIRAVQEVLKTKDPEIGPLVKTLIEVYDSHSASYVGLTLATETTAAAEREIQGIQRRIDGLGKSLTTIYDVIKPGLDAPARARIENAFLELDAGDSFFASWFKGMIMMQPDTLTLLLVLFMGVLGSSLQMTHAYFKASRIEMLGGYFLRCCVGALAALVIFVVAKAGVPVIADASRFGGEAAINPYFVSFVAIVSGLMSENAIANVQAQGARLFGGAGGSVRWALTDLNPELTKQSLELKNLSAELGVSDEVAKSMLKGEHPIEPAQQKVIALFLRKKQRDLFTDVAPPKG